MATVSAPTQEPVTEEQRFLLRGVDWETYRKISDALAGRHLRLSYDRGNLEFMTISGAHGHISRLLFQLILVLVVELGLPRRSFGDMTCDRADLERGLNPDECFYIRSAPLVRGKLDVDLAKDPPPDLAVEIELSRGAPNRLAIYAALGIPEIWRFDGAKLVILKLKRNRRYEPCKRSLQFPFVAGNDLARFLNQRSERDEDVIVESFRDWVREKIRAKG